MPRPLAHRQRSSDSPARLGHSAPSGRSASSGARTALRLVACALLLGGSGALGLALSGGAARAGDPGTGTAEPAREADPRDAYDVRAYRLDLGVDPAARRIRGTGAVELVVVADELAAIVLDLDSDDLRASGARLLAEPALDGTRALAGVALEPVHADDRLVLPLPRPVERGAVLAVAVDYEGAPRARNSFDGFHWEETASGAPWIGTSCQGLGAHSWWPCKASYFNPDDKAERLFVNATVPAGLTAVSNGRLAEVVPAGDDRRTFRWEHPYPCETYAVTLNVAPYVHVARELELEGLAEPVPFHYWVLPEDAEKAAVQFAEVPELLAVFGRAFGPFPFPAAKFGLVQTSFWGMEHSTAVAYGSSFPAWTAQTGASDRWAARNRFFDYILVHEVAHEWWGNAVSAADWGDFWIHEGFGTYAEGVFVELTQGRERADELFETWRRPAQNPRGRLWRGADPTSGEAYAGLVYTKGAWVLNTLRHYVADDEAWWRTLRAFNVEHRYGHATTADFRAVLERETGRKWARFFDEWYYGVGVPRIRGTVEVGDRGLVVEVACDGTNETGFHVPLDLAWREGDSERTVRLELAPGKNELRVGTSERPADVRVVDLHRVLGRHEVKVE